MNSYGYQYIVYEQEYLDRLDAIGNIESIKSLSINVKSLKERKGMLNNANEHYIKVNQSFINKAIKAKKMAEIRDSGLLDDID